VTAAVAGDPSAAHKKGCEMLESICTVHNKRKADIVITTNGGAPLDQNIYQSVKGLTAAEAAAKEGATLITRSACADGTGGDGFYHALKECASPQALLNEVEKISASATRPDQWEYQIMAHHKVIFVCDPKTQAVAREMKLETADTVQEAFERALKEKPEAKITVIPDGVSIIVK
jgi:nickel-dependent lactate racemase